MKFRLYSSLFFLFVFFIAAGQTEKIKTADGEFTFRQYAYNIIKLTWEPNGYFTNENITDAVILKPFQDKSYKKIFKPLFDQSIFFKNTRIDFSKGKIYLTRLPEIKNTRIEKKENRKPQTGNTSRNTIVMENVFQKDEFNGFRFKLQPDEKIYGGGERAIPLSRRGYKLPLYNNPWYGYSEGADALNYSVPFFTSSNGYGLFFDNASKGYADIGKATNDIFEAGFMSGELNVYVIFGKDYKEILSSYYNLTGTQPLPPRWALGNFMSRFGYSGEADVKNIASKMKQEKIPFDAVIFDLFWFGDSIKGTLGNLDWVNRTKWPDPTKMMGDFKKDNINTVLIAEPFILKGTKSYDKAKKYFSVDSAGNPFNLTDFYFGQGGLLDIFRKDAGDWIWNEHYKKQIANGAAGWWTDLGEPEKHPPEIRHNLKDEGVKRLMTADEVHNVYGHYWNKMLFKNYAGELPGQRLFHLNRSGFAGSQRYSIFPWSGDVSRSWGGLRAQLPVMLGMSMSGVPYIHADAGGFAGGEGDNELYVRWLQFASFTPIFRPHGTALFELDKNAFSFPSEPALIDEPWRSYAKEVVKLRYSLLPYNYTLAWRQASKSEPLVAPLYYYYPDDESAVSVEDEFMWGEHILVAPVLQKGATQRKLYLPGGNWYVLDNFSNGKAGAETYRSFINFDVSVDVEPVFVKAGSFIPMVMHSGGENTKAYTTDSMVIHYYSDDKPSQYTMFDDDGNNKYSIPQRLFELIDFKAIPSGQKLSFNISSNGVLFKGRPSKRIIKMIVHGRFDFTKNMYINGQPSTKAQPVIGSDGGTRNYYFTFELSRKPVIIELK